ncbi:OmpA family protein [Hymenobacter sp. HMF4947]|uniref:OmpA family protein n=1 Tax=Hymenobacter ginkgonis TaxID=2682976 RepID=A0A7K1TF00_9BACT|nr:OmpA family protein [Hymenobacter ginkgonis]MVN76987.1 OmpA family protein [Hymenobacter ginkgonis]
MKNNLVEAVKFNFTAEVIDQLANVIGEDPANVKKGLSQAVPLVLATLVHQAEQEGSPAALLHMARETDATSMLSSQGDVRNAACYEQGGAILVELLGSDYGTAVSRLAMEADMRPGATEMLLQVVAAAVLGVLGRYAAENGLTPSAFVQWLQAQQHDVAAAMLPTLQPGRGMALPTGPRATAAVVPPRQLSAAVRRMPQPMPGAGYGPSSEPRSSGGLRWQWGLLLLVAVSLGYFFGRGPATESAAPAAPTAVPAAKPAVAAGRYDQGSDTYIYDTGQPIRLRLSDGTTQQVGANSTENRLYTFLATPSVQVDSVNRTKGWINFDRVYFDPGKATLTAESNQQLRNVASILKTFPHAIVKIGGYTDSSGVALHNFQLSEERAKAAMLALASMGVPVDNLQAKGYGSKYYVTSNNTPSGRALNRRISVRVVQK